MDRYSIGVDVGGTFTDSVVRDQTGRFVYDKAFTTPGNLEEGVLKCLENAAERWDLSLTELLAGAEVFKIGTTSAVNRLINRAGARVALLTTKGHEDAIFIGRVQQKTDGLSDVERADIRRWSKVDPVVPRTRVWGLNERIDSHGQVVCPLGDGEVESLVHQLVQDNTESVACCFLWSFLNPVHEKQVKEIIRRVAPSIFVTLSSEIAPQLGEYERACTTVLNSYLGPGTRADLERLERALHQEGLEPGVFLMQSTGGVVPATEAVDRPVYLMASGPVGGVAAAQAFGASSGTQNIITTDMGGTSFDVGVIVQGHAIEKSPTLQNRYRILVSAVEVSSIGAGGGSIASIDRITKVLQVGPQSAGAKPGPVCYGFGGSEPTVTDANAVLGRLNPDRFFAGRHRLDVAAAQAAIKEKLSEPLGVSMERAAAAILSVVDHRMADLIRNLTIERGHDPRDFTLVAFGGGAPLHAGSYGREIQAATVLIPRAASSYSAWGIAHSPIVRDYALSAPTTLPVESSELSKRFQELEQRDQSIGSGTKSATESSLYVDMRYRYQHQELRVPVDRQELTRQDVANRLMERFEELYERQFGAGSTLRSAGIEIAAYRITVTEEFQSTSDRPDLGRNDAQEPIDTREVWFDDAFQPVDIYDADAAGPGFEVSGPCMLEGGLLTIVVGSSQRIQVDAAGNYLLTTGA